MWRFLVIVVRSPVSILGFILMTLVGMPFCLVAAAGSALFQVGLVPFLALGALFMNQPSDMPRADSILDDAREWMRGIPEAYDALGRWASGE
jgi:hypothetical protein